MFPYEIVNILICEYKDALLLVKTCKLCLRIALSRDCLIKLVNRYIDIPRYIPQLPFFFYASLPYHLIDMPYELDIELNLKRCSVAGGYIVKSIYNKKYISDIDVWIKCNIKADLKDIQALTDITKYDLIIKRSEPYTCISTSDLSICQQCVVYNNKGRKILHVTPLSLYTYYMKKIIITVAPLSRRYDSDYSSKGEHIMYAINYLYEHIRRREYHNIVCNKCEHNNFNEYNKCVQCGFSLNNINVLHYPMLHNCEDCIGVWREEDEEYNHINKWFIRIRKYEERFPDYQLIYVDKPSNRFEINNIF